jgi:hypothetical protein
MVRAGAQVAPENLNMKEVMTMRFGDPIGYVTDSPATNTEQLQEIKSITN